MRALTLVTGAIAVMGCIGAAGYKSDGSVDYLAQLVDAEKAVAKLPPGDKPARQAAYQMLAQSRSMAGDYMGGVEAWEEMSSEYSPDAAPVAPSPADVDQAHQMLEDFEPVPAIPAILRASKDRQIVILNEAHHIARHRVFALELALALRKEGFRYLAVETLLAPTEPLAKRGYPVGRDGWYTNEPLFGDFIRQALRAGYTPIRYEQLDSSRTVQDPRAQIESREEDEANNLIAATLSRDPKARIFVYVGYAHAYKGASDWGIPWMAERLRKKTGLDPLSIDQNSIIEPRPGTHFRALVDAMFEGNSSESMVLLSREGAGKVHSLDEARVDITVFHRPTRLIDGRPDWMSMHGYREVMPIPVKLLPKKGRRIIQAFVESESNDAVPMDQVLLSAGETPPVFMLPKGNYRFAYRD